MYNYQEVQWCRQTSAAPLYFHTTEYSTLDCIKKRTLHYITNDVWLHPARCITISRTWKSDATAKAYWIVQYPMKLLYMDAYKNTYFSCVLYKQIAGSRNKQPIVVTRSMCSHQKDVRVIRITSVRSLLWLLANPASSYPSDRWLFG